MNLASRLCDEALPGQILVSRRVLAEVEEFAGGRARRRAHAQRLREAGRRLRVLDVDVAQVPA